MKSLITCKCVCKTRYELISNSDFVKLHIDQAISNNYLNLMINGRMRIGSKSYDLIYSVSHKSIKSFSSTDEFQTYAMEMDYPLKSDGFAVSFLGSCNGLVCLRLSHPLRKLCCIWNPVSKEYKEIPEPPDASGPFDFSCFGYDPKTDDYKLVIGEHIYISISRIQVYSLRSNSWESSIPVPYRFCNEFNGVGAVLVHGNLHWLADDDYQNQFVVSFDIIEEHFEKLQLPKQPLKNKNWFISLGVLAGCLCVLVEVVQVCVELWVMRDYGVQES